MTRKAFTNGSLPQAHLRITTLRVQLVTKAQGPGSLKGKSFSVG